MLVREDFRRDGLAANFLANSYLMQLAAKSIPGSRMNIGYPAICTEEYKRCEDILNNASGHLTELCVVGHARGDQLEHMAKIVNGYENVTANSWIPISDHFLNQTVKKSARETFSGLKQIIKTWHDKSDKPFDLAFADCTSPEKGLSDRVYDWAEYCVENGVRNLIICDTRGIGTPEQAEELFEKLAPIAEHIEFHPHNDNGYGITNVEVAIQNGVQVIGTSFYGSGERKSMLTPQDIIPYGLDFDQETFTQFDQEYRKQIGTPEQILDEVYNMNVIVTGSQFRLRKRDPNLEMRFGVTTDTYIASMMAGTEVTGKELANLKNTLLYKRGNISLNTAQLRGELDD